MSHDATNWAIKQRGLKPAAKVVLWHLCDRYHPDHGCFPSLDTLADDCEMSRRSVQDQLEILEAAGLVIVDKMPREAGRLPRNQYRFSFEMGSNHLGQNLPLAKSALGKNEQPPLANFDDHLGQNLPTNLVRVTSKRTSKKAHDPEALSILCRVVSPEVAQGFLDMRQKKGAYLTEFAAGLIVKELRGHPAPDAVIEASIRSNWTGIYPDKIGGQNDPTSNGRLSRADATTLAIAVAGRTRRAPDPDFL